MKKNEMTDEEKKRVDEFSLKLKALMEEFGIIIDGVTEEKEIFKYSLIVAKVKG